MGGTRQFSTDEDRDQNNQEAHNPVEAGKKAIEASKQANDRNLPDSAKQEQDEKDAERWRNEG